MRKYCFIFIICLIIYSAGSKEIPFKIERLNSDFNGIVTNGINILCYGDYGMITYTLDSGKTWKQLNIGDQYNLRSIKNYNNDFIGITDNSILKSIDNGLNWNIKQVSNEAYFIDMALHNDLIYILTKNSILKSDISLNISANPILFLDTNSQYSDIETDGDNLYFISNQKLLNIYNLNNQTLDTVNLIEYFNCIYCTNISGLKIVNNKLYILLNQKSADDLYNSYFLSSSNQGKSWQKLTIQIHNCQTYNIINDSIFFFRPVQKCDSLSNSFFVNGYFMVDSSHYDVDSSYITQVNNLETISRYIRYDQKNQYKDYLAINNNIIIAIGNNKMISVSNNAGKSFEFKSIFNGFFDNYENITILNDSLFYVNNYYEFYKTSNGGLTWLPQTYSDYYNNTTCSHPHYCFFDINGNGFAKFQSINTNSDSSSLITKDYGESFFKSNKAEYSIPSLNTITPLGIDLGSIFIFVLNKTKSSTGDFSYLILRYDKSLKLIDSVNLKTDEILNIAKIDTNTLIALTLTRKIQESKQ